MTTFAGTARMAMFEMNHVHGAAGSVQSLRSWTYGGQVIHRMATHRYRRLAAPPDQIRRRGAT